LAGAFSNGYAFANGEGKWITYPFLLIKAQNVGNNVSNSQFVTKLAIIVINESISLVAVIYKRKGV